MAVSSTAIDDREFLVVRGGYDIEQVKAYLGEVEASFRRLERWAVKAKARLETAEENGRGRYDVDEAMIAVFAAKDRVLKQGRLQAERIEAEARDQARGDYEDAAAEIIEGAKEEARRIIEAALVTSERFQYESTLGEARVEANRIVQEARSKAERLLARSQADQPGSEDMSGDSLVVDLTDDGDRNEAEDGGAPRLTHYQRQSAGLPSLGEAAFDVLRSLERLREHSRRDRTN